MPTSRSSFDLDADLLAALAHPARLQILDLLNAGEACVCHIEAALGYRQAYISQQLMVLRDAGLVQDRREGLNIYYHVTKPEIFAALDAVRRVTGQRPRVTTRKARYLDACPCPKCAAALEKTTA